jgi:hypothetical protein
VLAEQPDGAPLSLTVVRGGRGRTVSIDVPSGCRALVEIRAVSGSTRGPTAG